MRQVLSLIVGCALIAAGCGGTPRLGCDPNPPLGMVGSICGFVNPEDVEVVASAGLLLVSEMRRGTGSGSVAAIPLDPLAQKRIPLHRLWTGADRTRDVAADPPVGDPSCTQPPPPERFAPHGLTSRPLGDGGVVRVAVVGHDFREAVELFDLSGSGQAATMAWRGCVRLPPGMVGNDVSMGKDGEIVVSDYMPTMTGWRGFYYTLASGMGRDTGAILAWTPQHGWRRLPGTEAAGPNGVLVSPDGASVYYAETGSGLVWRVPLHEEGEQSAASRRVVVIGGNPDNLSLAANGRILAVTHTDGAAFLLCALGRRPCRTGWSLIEIDPVGMSTRLLLHHDGSVVGAVASAAEFQGRYYFGAVFDDRIGVWQPKSATE